MRLAVKLLMWMCCAGEATGMPVGKYVGNEGGGAWTGDKCFFVFMSKYLIWEAN